MVEEEGVYECAICGAQFPGINMLGQHCKVFIFLSEGSCMFPFRKWLKWNKKVKLQVHMEGQEPRVCQEEIVMNPNNVDQHEEKKFKSL